MGPVNEPAASGQSGSGAPSYRRFAHDMKRFLGFNFLYTVTPACIMKQTFFSFHRIASIIYIDNKIKGNHIVADTRKERITRNT
jgi:hypothetical protein